MARKKLKAADKPGFDLYRGGLRYRFTYKGVRRAVYGKTEDECRQKERDLIQRLDQGIYKPGKDLTLQEYFERWTDNRRGSVKESTICTKSIAFKTMAAIVIDAEGVRFGDIKLSDVTKQTIISMRNVLGEKLNTRSVNEYMTALSAMFKAAVIDEYIAKNPCAGVKSLKHYEPLARDSIHRALSRQETEAFFAAANRSWYKNLFTFLLYTGCRIGEAGAIFLEDIGPDGVTICRTVTKTENGGYMIGDDAKTEAGRRFIPLDPKARAAIEGQMAITEAITGCAPGKDRPIFTSLYGSLLKPSSINANIETICRKANIERFTVHAFRDTFATRCVESGMQPKTLQEILGHKDISLTMNLYAHVMNESKIEQMKNVTFI